MYAATHKKTVKHALDYMWSDPNADPMMRAAVRLFVWKESPFIATLYMFSPDILADPQTSSLHATFQGTEVTLSKPEGYPLEVQEVYEMWRDLVAESSAEPDCVDDTWLQSDYPFAFIQLEDQYTRRSGIQFYSLDDMNVTTLNHFMNMLRPGAYNPSQRDGYAYQHSYYRDLGDTPADWNVIDIATHGDWRWSRDLQLAFYAELGELRIFRQATETDQEYSFESGKPDSNWNIQPICSDEKRNRGVIWNSCDNIGRFWADKFMSAVYGDYYEDGWFSDNFFSNKFIHGRVVFGYGFIFHAIIDAVTAHHLIPTMGDRHGSHKAYEEFIKKAYNENTLPNVHPFDSRTWNSFKRRLSENRFQPVDYRVRDSIRLAAEHSMLNGIREMVDLTEAWRTAEELAADVAQQIVPFEGEQGYWPNCPSGLPSGYLDHPHNGKCDRCPVNDEDNERRKICEVLWGRRRGTFYDTTIAEHYFWGGALHHQTWERDAHKFLNIGTTAIMAAVTQMAWAKFGPETGLGESEIFYELTKQSTGSFDSPVGMESFHPHRVNESHEIDIHSSCTEIVDSLSLLFMSETQLDPGCRLRIQLKVSTRKASYDENRQWHLDYDDQGTIKWENADIAFMGRSVTGIIDMSSFGSGGPGYWENKRFNVLAGQVAGGEVRFDENGNEIEASRYQIVRSIIGLRIEIEPKSAVPFPEPVLWGFGLLRLEQNNRVDPVYLAKLNQFRQQVLGQANGLYPGSHQELTASLAEKSRYSLKLADSNLFEMTQDQIVDALCPYGLSSSHPHGREEKVTRDLKTNPFERLNSIDFSFVVKSRLQNDCHLKVELKHRKRITDKTTNGWVYRKGAEISLVPAAIESANGEILFFGCLDSEFFTEQNLGRTLRLSLSTGSQKIPAIKTIDNQTKEVSDICGIAFCIEVKKETTRPLQKVAWGFAVKDMKLNTVHDDLFSSSLRIAPELSAASYKSVFKAVKQMPKRSWQKASAPKMDRFSPIDANTFMQTPFVESLDSTLTKLQKRHLGMIEAEKEIEKLCQSHLPAFVQMIEDWDKNENKGTTQSNEFLSAAELLDPNRLEKTIIKEGSFREPTTAEVNEPKAFLKYMRSYASYNARRDACRLTAALLTLEARQSVYKGQGLPKKVQALQKNIDRGRYLQKCLFTYLQSLSIDPGDLLKTPIESNKPYLFNKNTKETHRTDAPCKFAYYVQPKYREYVNEVDEGKCYCDYCFPEKADG
jgi:hypothetical protein